MEIAANPLRENGEKTQKENFFRKISNLPLAVFVSSGIFLPVAGNDGDDSNETLS
ncbi:MAG: hypothetical protein IJO06_11285 [Thermoguttaceae bacterium]|nr:hypothetical protein [Thermoguttaceae bacterium]